MRNDWMIAASLVLAALLQASAVPPRINIEAKQSTVPYCPAPGLGKDPSEMNCHERNVYRANMNSDVPKTLEEMEDLVRKHVFEEMPEVLSIYHNLKEDIPFDKNAKLDSESLLAALKQEFGDQLHVHQSASHPDSYKVRLNIEGRIIKMTLCQKFCQICLGGTINIPLTGMSVETFSHFIRHFFDDYDELDRQWTEKITDASKEITLRNIKANIVSAQLEKPLEALHHTVKPRFTKMLLSVSLSPNNDLKFSLPYDVEKSVIDSIADFVNDIKAFQDELNAKVDVYGVFR